MLVKVVLLCLHLLSLALAATTDTLRHTARADSLSNGAMTVAVFEETTETNT